MYTESTVCLTPPSTGSILLVALLKPVPVLNFDFVMFIFQKPIWGLSASAVMRAAVALATMTPSTPATTDDCLNAICISRGSLHERGSPARKFRAIPSFPCIANVPHPTRHTEAQRH